MINRLQKNSLSPRLLKKVQMQGGTPKTGVPTEVGPGVLEVRRREWRGGPTQQMGLFQQPVGLRQGRPFPSSAAAARAAYTGRRGAARPSRPGVCDAPEAAVKGEVPAKFRP